MENINGKTILAIGAHVGDMELTAGALLASCAVSGGSQRIERKLAVHREVLLKQA